MRRRLRRSPRCVRGGGLVRRPRGLRRHRVPRLRRALQDARAPSGRGRQHRRQARHLPQPPRICGAGACIDSKLLSETVCWVTCIAGTKRNLARSFA